MFPHPCGDELAKQVAKGADPDTVVPDDWVVVRGGASEIGPAGDPFSGAVGPTLEAAAVAVPHGQIRVTTVGAVRAQGGKVTWVPEVSRHGTVNQQHVNIIPGGPSGFSDLRANPVPRPRRVDGDKK